MLDPVNQVIETLKKEKKEFVVNFTPKASNSEYKRRNRFDYVTRVHGGKYMYLKYGYYEIKNSSLGPIISPLIKQIKFPFLSLCWLFTISFSASDTGYGHQHRF